MTIRQLWHGELLQHVAQDVGARGDVHEVRHALAIVPGFAHAAADLLRQAGHVGRNLKCCRTAEMSRRLRSVSG